jgi:glycosyltransferase involved in cell wall biosynthesis
LNILHVCESLPGGPASYLDEVLPAQRKRFGERNVVLLAPTSQMEHLALSSGSDVVGYRRTGRNASSLARLTVALQRQLARQRPDILHLHSSLAGAIGRLVASTTGFNGRVVYCAHGWAIDPGRRSKGRDLFRLAERVLYLASDAIINISPHEDAFLPAAWRRSGKVRLIPSGIAPAPAEAQAAEPRPCDEEQPGQPLCWRLLFVGRTDYQKGFDLLLQEMAGLTSARLVVAGGHVVEATCELACPPNVAILGWLPRSGVRDLMARADFVVMPSRWEGMPLVALEAMRAGKPVIASADGAFPHILEHGRTGLLVDTREPGFLGRALEGLARADAIRMGAAASEAFQQRFTSAAMNDQLFRLYEELRSAPPARVRLSGLAHPAPLAGS